MGIDHKIFTTPLIDSVASYVIEQPIQYYTYKTIFSKMSSTAAAAGIASVSLIVNIVVLILVYILVMDTSIKDKKLWKQVFLSAVAGILLMPVYTYLSLHLLKDYSPEKRIIIHTTVLYVLTYFGKVIVTYFVWSKKNGDKSE